MNSLLSILQNDVFSPVCEAIKRNAPETAELLLMDIDADIAEFALVGKDVALLEKASKECWKHIR